MLDKLKYKLEAEAVSVIGEATGGIPEEFRDVLCSCVTHSDHLELSLLACASSVWCGSTVDAGMPVATASLMLRAGISVQLALPEFRKMKYHKSIPAEDLDAATIILAGDALLALSMEHLAANGGRHSSRLLDEAVKALGSKGILAGLSLEIDQMDQEASFVPDGRAIWEVTSGQVARFASMGGALMSGASQSMLDDAAQIGLLVGRARHLVDRAASTDSKTEEKTWLFQARTLMEQAEMIAGHSSDTSLLKSIMYLSDFI